MRSLSALNRWFTFFLTAGMLVCTAPSAWAQTSPPLNTKTAVERATNFLLSKQSVDGAWHSESYGAMKQGAANTSLILYALSELPEEVLAQHTDSIEKARAFLLPGIEQMGCVANPDGSLDYPIYSTAMILTVHKRIDLQLTPAQTERMVDFLVASQCSQDRGFKEDNPNLGGWDILGPGSTRGKTAGANVSVTFFVLEALSQYDDRQVTKDSIAMAKNWCQQILDNSSDGGFYFTSQLNSSLNKAGWKDQEFKSPQSYGSATCDGLLILLATRDQQDKTANIAITQSKGWLTSNPGIESVPGFDKEANMIGWPASLRFYYMCSLSRLLVEFDDDFGDKTKKAISAQLLDSQRKNGSWENEFSRMREDDPLIATPFGLIALIHCMR